VLTRGEGSACVALKRRQPAPRRGVTSGEREERRLSTKREKGRRDRGAIEGYNVAGKTKVDDPVLGESGE